MCGERTCQMRHFIHFFCMYDMKPSISNFEYGIHVVKIMDDTHDRSMHQPCLAHVARMLASKGFTAWRWDCRGNGASEGGRSFTGKQEIGDMCTLAEAVRYHSVCREKPTKCTHVCLFIWSIDTRTHTIYHIIHCLRCTSKHVHHAYDFPLPLPLSLCGLYLRLWDG